VQERDVVRVGAAAVEFDAAVTTRRGDRGTPDDADGAIAAVERAALQVRFGAVGRLAAAAADCTFRIATALAS
jgi:hypothetical protein